MDGLNILLKEDSEQDIFLISEVLEDSGILKSLNVVTNGVKAMQFLNKDASYKDQLLPNLILLDINMPLMDGHETLAYIKSHDSLKHIAVIMLTTSSSSNDIKRAYSNHANSYIIKPHNIKELDNTINKLKEFWLNTAKLSN
jgi:CheY-like chemotaxis protein